MKKIFALMSAAVLALGFTACSSDAEETIEGGVSKQLKLNITVSNLNEEAGTRAVKTDWENGDQINIWYDSNVTQNPDLVIKYNGHSWAIDETAEVSGATPSSASGSLRAVYVQGGLAQTSRYNNLSSFFGYPCASFDAAYSTTYMNGSRLRMATPLISTDKSSYTYDSETLTTELNAWSFSYTNNAQVVITNLPSGTWVLKCDKLMPRTGFGFGDGNFSTSNTEVNSYTLASDNADGKAFLFYVYTASGDFTFTLYDIDTDTSKTYTATGKTLDTSGKLNAIKINYSKFN